MIVLAIPYSGHKERIRLVKTIQREHKRIKYMEDLDKLLYIVLEDKLN